MKKKRYTKDDLFCRYCGRTHPTKRERDRCQNECRKKERDAWNEENLGLCYITCPICGKCVSVLLRHVKRTHGMSKEEFKRLYPDMKTITNEARKNYSKSNSEETRKKISESNKGRTSPMKGKHLSEERIKRMSELMKGKVTTLGWLA